MVTPPDRQVVSTAFTDEPMTLEQLVHRTGLSKLRVNDALDELVDAERIHSGANSTWSLRPFRKGKTMSNIPTPPSPPTPGAKKAAAKKVPAAKKAPAVKKAPAAKKEPAVKKDVKSHSEIEERDNAALGFITGAKDGLTKDEVTAAMEIESGLVHMSLYRLNRDKKITKSAAKGEGRQVKWVVSG